MAPFVRRSVYPVSGFPVLRVRAVICYHDSPCTSFIRRSFSARTSGGKRKKRLNSAEGRVSASHRHVLVDLLACTVGHPTPTVGAGSHAE